MRYVVAVDCSFMEPTRNDVASYSREIRRQFDSRLLLVAVAFHAVALAAALSTRPVHRRSKQLDGRRQTRFCPSTLLSFKPISRRSGLVALRRGGWFAWLNRSTAVVISKTLLRCFPVHSVSLRQQRREHEISSSTT